MKGVYAIGDVTDLGEMLAHVASFKGEMVTEIIAGKDRVYDPVAVPTVVFTEPEIVSVGPPLKKQKKQDILLSQVNSLLQQMGISNPRSRKNWWIRQSCRSRGRPQNSRNTSSRNSR